MACFEEADQGLDCQSRSQKRPRCQIIIIMVTGGAIDEIRQPPNVTFRRYERTPLQPLLFLPTKLWPRTLFPNMHVEYTKQTKNEESHQIVNFSQIILINLLVSQLQTDELSNFSPIY